MVKKPSVNETKIIIRRVNQSMGCGLLKVFLLLGWGVMTHAPDITGQIKIGLTQHTQYRQKRDDEQLNEPTGYLRTNIHG